LQRVRAGRQLDGKTETENRSIILRFAEIVGEVAFGSLGHDQLRRYTRTVLRLPANPNKSRLLTPACTPDRFRRGYGLRNKKLCSAVLGI